MQDAHFLAVKPLSVKTTRASCADAVILNVMRHNARELQAEIGIGAESGIDASRIHLNVTMHGPATADGVASAARDAMREHGIVAPRKNATLGIEIVVSLPAGLAIDYLAYFRDAMAWAQQHYRVPLLSAIIHNDEKNPHLHLVLLPVRDGKLVGSELLGDRTTVKAMQKGFHEQVAKQYGLRMPTAKKRYSAAERAAGVALLRATLQRNGSLTDHAIDALLVPHAKNPEPLLLALGLVIPAPPVKGSFVATMTKKVRPENPNRGFTKSPIGDFGGDIVAGLKAENEMSYALFRTSISAPNISPQSAGIQVTDHQHPADGLLTSQHTPATTDQAAPISASTAPAKRKRTAASRQPGAATSTPAHRDENTTLAPVRPAVGGVHKISDTPQAVHHPDILAVVHRQPGAVDLASQSAESSAHLDALISQDILPPTASPTKATYAVGLVHHQGGAGAPSYAPRPKPSTTDRVPCANGMRTHKDVSKSGCISKGGGISPPPPGVPSFGQTPVEGMSNSGDPPSAGGDALKSQQVDQQAGQADAHRCSPAEGEHPSPRRGMVPAAKEYRLHRDEDHLATSWNEQFGEFAPTTGPPPTTSRHHAP